MTGEPPAPAGPVVMIVDDDPRVLATIERAVRLFLAGSAVIAARGCLEAVGLLARARIDAIATDFSMPDGDGDYVLAVAAEKQPHALRILISAVTLLPAGIAAHHVLAKPHDVRYLCGLIRDHVATAGRTDPG